jgi:hypothetical protein
MPRLARKSQIPEPKSQVKFQVSKSKGSSRARGPFLDAFPFPHLRIGNFLGFGAWDLGFLRVARLGISREGYFVLALTHGAVEMFQRYVPPDAYRHA